MIIKPPQERVMTNAERADRIMLNKLLSSSSESSLIDQRNLLISLFDEHEAEIRRE